LDDEDEEEGGGPAAADTPLNGRLLALYAAETLKETRRYVNYQMPEAYIDINFLSGMSYNTVLILLSG
jgi:hypothetical protein